MKLSKNIRLLTWFNFFTDFKFYYPVAIIYFSSVTGSFALGMSIFAIVSLASAFFEVPTGIFSDLIGRKRTVIAGAIASLFSIICYALSFSYFILVAGAILEGFSRSLYSGNNDALLHNTLSQTGKKEEYHHYHGRLTGMFQVATAIAALAGGLIAFYSLPSVFWISIVPQLVCVYLALKLIEPAKNNETDSNIYSHLKESLINFIKNPKLRLLSISSIYGYGFGETSYQFRAAFINSVWPLWAVGIPSTLSSIGAAIGFFFAGKAITKFGAAKILLLGEIYSKIANFCSLIFVSIFSPILMSTTSIFYGLGSTAKSTLFQKEFTNNQRATMASLNSLAGSLFFAIIAFLIGLIADKFNPAQALLIVQIFTLFNLCVYWKLFKFKDQK